MAVAEMALPLATTAARRRRAVKAPSPRLVVKVEHPPLVGRAVPRRRVVKVEHPRDVVRAVHPPVAPAAAVDRAKQPGEHDLMRLQAHL